MSGRAEPIPKVGAYRTRDGAFLQFHCPYCGERHRHPVPPLPAGETVHRAAHCKGDRTDESYAGYFILEQGRRKRSNAQ